MHEYRRSPQVRSTKIGGHGLVGGRDDKHMYLVKHFLRAMLLFVAILLPNAFDAWKMKELQKYLPDEKEHVEFFADWTCAQVQEPA